MNQLITTTSIRHFTEFMNESRVDYPSSNGLVFRGNVLRLILADGGSMSVQASGFHYCSPRRDLESYAEYDSFEVGFPSCHYPELDAYQDGFGSDPTDTVYAYVPKEVLEQLFTRVGGVTAVLA